MKNGLNFCIALSVFLAVGCTTTRAADPTTYAHLSCEKLRGLYDPTSELFIPNIAKEHPGDSNYDRAQPDQREWKYEKEDREERTKFRSDVRAAYKMNGC